MLSRVRYVLPLLGNSDEVHKYTNQEVYSGIPFVLLQ